MNENDLRDCFAMFAMLGVTMDGSLNALSYQQKSDVKKEIATFAYELADAMLEARNKKPEQEIGIVAAKPRRRTKSA